MAPKSRINKHATNSHRRSTNKCQSTHPTLHFQHINPHQSRLSPTQLSSKARFTLSAKLPGNAHLLHLSHLTAPSILLPKSEIYLDSSRYNLSSRCHYRSRSNRSPSRCNLGLRQPRRKPLQYLHVRSLFRMPFIADSLSSLCTENETRPGHVHFSNPYSSCCVCLANPSLVLSQTCLVQQPEMGQSLPALPPLMLV
jgi:hypothetical protein